MARFAQYALAASEEALGDAGWMRTTADQKEATVCITFDGFYGLYQLTVCRESVWDRGLGTLMRSMILSSPMRKE